MRQHFVTPDHVRRTYDSVEDFALSGVERIPDVSYHGQYGAPGSMDTPLKDTHFYGKDAPTVAHVYRMAREGWDRHLSRTLDIARDAVTAVEREHETLAFNPVWDVAGGMVDMGAYLAGEPECMIDFPPAPVSKAGRVITLCASISVSGSISAESLISKGMLITALALELERMGMSVELIADQTVAGASPRRPGKPPVQRLFSQRITVKSPNDVLDPSKVLFAYAHPCMLRVLAFPHYHDLPREGEWPDSVGAGWSYGSPRPPVQDLPAGTIYLPESYSDRDTDTAELLTKHLTDLGLT